jgi:hypothetical protein
MGRALALLLLLGGWAGAETNKEIARRYFTEVWIGGKADKALDYFAAKVRVADARGGPGVEQTAAQQAEAIRNLCVVSSDCSQSRILSQMEEQGTVVTVWVLRARPKTLLASALAKALGAGQVDRRLVTILRFSEGKIVEMTMQRDDLGVYADLGLINGAVIFLYGLGGASGVALAWVIGRTLRK